LLLPAFAESIFALLVESAVSTLSFVSVLLQDHSIVAATTIAAVTFFIRILFFNKSWLADKG
jgi:hypothetical protein